MITPVQSIILEPSGESFTLVRKDENAERHLVAFAPSYSRRIVSKALRFRNMHVEIPYIREDMIEVKPCPPSLTCNVRWPLRALPPYCDFDADTGTVFVRSLDEFSRLTLHPNRQHVLIRCMIPIPPSNKHAFELVQRFSVHEIPKRFAHAYRLATCVSKRISRLEGIHERTLLAVAKSSTVSSITQYMRTKLPIPVMCSKTSVRPNWDVASKNSLLPVSLRRIMIKLQDAEKEEEEEAEFDLPPMGVRLEVSSVATFQFISKTKTVHTFVHSDGSSLNLRDDFVTHIRPVRKQEYVSDSDEMLDQYSISSLYQVRALPASSTDYDIASIVLRSQQLRESVSAYSTVHDEDKDDDLVKINSDSPTKCVIPKLGRFIQFPDNRVRVTFEDRTIVMLDSKRTSASIVWPDGSSQTISLSPMVLTNRVRTFVEPALRFGLWANQRPSERARTMRSILRRKSVVRRALSSSSSHHNIVVPNHNQISSGSSSSSIEDRKPYCGDGDNFVIDRSLSRSNRQIEKIDAIFRRCSSTISSSSLNDDE